MQITTHRTPHPFFTPTHLSLGPHQSNQGKSSTSEWQSRTTSEWQSRKARKGRYAPKSTTVHYTPDSTHNQPGRLEKEEKYIRDECILRAKDEKTKFKPGLKFDISFWEASLFTLGSVFWVINGFLVWFPILRPSLATPSFSHAAAATAFIGGSIFEIGSYFMVIEALDRGREISFGTAIGQLLHHHRYIKPKSSSSSTTSSGSEVNKKALSEEKWQTAVRPSVTDEKKTTWIWWGKPMWHDLGYMAGLIQLIAATVFWVSTLTGLPGVIPGFSSGGGSTAIIDVFFWAPQVIGGTGFILSSLCLMVETQHNWYTPNLFDIGWQVGVWNLIGSFGFTLCGGFGFSKNSGIEYQSGLSTFWGSWAFLIGSLCQMYEVIWREPSP